MDNVQELKGRMFLTREEFQGLLDTVRCNIVLSYDINGKHNKAPESLIFIIATQVKCCYRLLDTPDALKVRSSSIDDILNRYGRVINLIDALAMGEPWHIEIPGKFKVVTKELNILLDSLKYFERAVLIRDREMSKINSAIITNIIEDDKPVDDKFQSIIEYWGEGRLIGQPSLETLNRVTRTKIVFVFNKYNGTPPVEVMEQLQDELIQHIKVIYPTAYTQLTANGFKFTPDVLLSIAEGGFLPLGYSTEIDSMIDKEQLDKLLASYNLPHDGCPPKTGLGDNHESE